MPDLLIGNVYGDLLILQGNGDGTFRPYRKADQAVALAVADLTGDGKPDFIYADQGLDRVVVQYGTDQTKVLGDQSSGLLSPGAVKLADLNGDGIPDLIVANSGSNNVLVYPGLGDGQFGPALNGGHGFFAGTNPTGIAVANLNGQPDLIVANSGLERRVDPAGPGHRLELDARARAADQDRRRAGGRGRGKPPGHGQARPRRGQPAGQQRPGLPGRRRRVLRPERHDLRRGPGAQRAVPGQLRRLGHWGSRRSNAGSNTISLIDPGGVTQTIATGGLAADHRGSRAISPAAASPTWWWATAATASSRCSLGGAGGLSLSQSTTSAAVPSPTSLSFAGVSDGVLSFYVATAGREAASLWPSTSMPRPTRPAPLSGGDLAGATGQSAGSVLAAATTGDLPAGGPAPGHCAARPST